MRVRYRRKNSGIIENVHVHEVYYGSWYVIDCVIPQEIGLSQAQHLQKIVARVEERICDTL